MKDWPKFWFNVNLSGSNPPNGIYRVNVWREKDQNLLNQSMFAEKSLKVTLRGLDRHPYAVLISANTVSLNLFVTTGSLVVLHRIIFGMDFTKEAQEQSDNWGIPIKEKKEPTEIPIIFPATNPQAVINFLAQEDCP